MELVNPINKLITRWPFLKKLDIISMAVKVVYEPNLGLVGKHDDKMPGQDCESSL